jgi:glycosyltransferase involved in cell wall biosynthesis
MLGVAFKTNLVGKLKRIVKNIFIVPLLKKCAGVLTIGARNEDYFRYLGINDSKFLRVPFSVDTKIFTQSIEGKMEMKSRFCLEYNFDPKKKIFLFVGKIRVSKGVFDLLDQASQLPESYFVFVGDGTDFDRFEKLSKALPNVLIMGFRNQSELPAIYGVADFIILPSHYESWGLSVNEGIAAGCVPIVSDVCGCSPELVETTSKLIFESQNRMSLLKVLQDSLLLQDSKKVYLDLLKVSSEHSIESSADKFVKVILNS